MSVEKREPYCLWHNKPLREVTEHEYDTCECECMDCLELVVPEPYQPKGE